MCEGRLSKCFKINFRHLVFKRLWPEIVQGYRVRNGIQSDASQVESLPLLRQSMLRGCQDFLHHHLNNANSQSKHEKLSINSGISSNKTLDGRKSSLREARSQRL